VRIWDETGREGAWSEPAWFEAGLLDGAGWNGAQWIGSTQDYRKPQPVPADLMGPWIAAVDDSRLVGGFFIDVDLPDKPVVSAMAYGGSGSKINRGSVVVNYGRLAPYYQRAMDRVGRRGDGFSDIAFYLFPGEKNRIGLRFEHPATGIAGTFGMRIVFADGTEMLLSSSPQWKALCPGKPPGAVKVAEAYGGSANGVVNQFPQTDLPPTWFRRRVRIGEGLVRARLYLCALGQGRAYLNGNPVDPVFFSSPQSDYEAFGYYTVNDITGLLSQGENTLAVLLDGGWYHQVGGFGAVLSYGRPGLKALVRLDYADGRTEYVSSDRDWQWKESAIRSANIYRGERVDFRLDQDEWKQAGSGSGWKMARQIPPCTPRTVAVDVNPVRCDGEIVPVKSWKIGSQTWLFDLGAMTHGVVRLRFDEPAGKTVRLRYSEYAEDGALQNVPLSHWLCHGVTQMDELVADGKPRVYESLFATKSFRFVEVSGLSRAPKPGDLVALPVHTQAEVLSSFHSSDPMLNRLYENGIRTFQNYISHVTGDIPRERCLWGADSIYSEVPAIYCFDWAPNHRLMNTLWWTGAGLKDGTPGMIGVGKRLTTMTQSFLWSSTPVFLTSMMAEFYGDLEPAKTYYDRILHFARTYEKTDVDGIPQPHLLGDHAAPMFVPRQKEDNALINTMAFFAVENRFARLADRLGKTTDAAHARAYAETIRTAVMKRYDAANHTFGNGTQDSLALAYGLISDPVEEKELAASLAGYYRANGHRFDGGFMSYEIYPMLSRFGYVEDAYAMLVNPDYPGPAWSIQTLDATSFFERYVTNMDEQKKVGWNFMAFAHSIGWMITDLAGIRYAEGIPNGKRMELAPQVPASGKLEQVEASLKTPMGTVESSWSCKGDLFTWSFAIPANTVAEVTIPAVAGSAIKGTENMVPLQTADGRAVFEAAAGTYTIQSRWR